MVNLFDYDLAGLRALLTGWGQPRFRADQLIQWLHQKGERDFSKMTNLQLRFRQQLAEQACVDLPTVALDTLSSDGTRKWLFSLAGGNRIETVFIPEADRGTLCISSQVGCGLNCSFCHTALQGFNRNLTQAEIIGQVFLARSLLQAQPTPAKITNVVFMGMGEPLLNRQAVVGAMNLLMDDLGYGLSKYRVTLSTSGLVPQMAQLKTESDCALAVSLHAPTDALRDELVPINKKYNIASLMAMCRDYFPTGSRRKITFEYVMLDGVNDSLAQAKALARILAGVPAKVNLIPFNSFAKARYRCSSSQTIWAFAQYLNKAGIVTTVRRTRGNDIAAACGQLAGQVKDRTSRARRMQAALAQHKDGADGR